eukprot:178231-Hanusia_phi.AAC.1
MSDRWLLMPAGDPSPSPSSPHSFSSCSAQTFLVLGMEKVKGEKDPQLVYQFVRNAKAALDEKDLIRD